MARIRALLRRTQPNRPAVYEFEDLLLDTGARQAKRGERVIQLTGKEYELLEFFMRHPRQVLTREMIYEEVWGYDFGGDSNIIEVYIRYLRQKLEAGDEPRLLHTMRGMGYVLERNPVGRTSTENVSSNPPGHVLCCACGRGIICLWPGSVQPIHRISCYNKLM